jgi:hypothetical protein
VDDFINGDKPLAPTSLLMDKTQLAQWILRRLGAPILRVELTEEHVMDDIEFAMHWFSAKKGVKRNAIMRVEAGRTAYHLPEEVDTVIDVAFPVPPMDISMIFSPFILIDDKVPYDVFAAPSSIGIYSSFTQTLQYVETAKRVLGADADWRQENRILHVFPIPKTDSGMIVEFKSTVFTIEQLNERDHDLLKRYALARAKEDLGRIRSKYDAFPTAQGSNTLDGKDLLEEAAREIEALDEELALSGFPMGFMHA